MNYRIAFTPQASEDFDFWKKTNPKTAEKIKRMLHELEEHPFVGTGKPFGYCLGNEIPLWR